MADEEDRGIGYGRKWLQHGIKHPIGDGGGIKRGCVVSHCSRGGSYGKLSVTSYIYLSASKPIAATLGQIKNRKKKKPYLTTKRNKTQVSWGT